jgi:hypothetical protein
MLLATWPDQRQCQPLMCCTCIPLPPADLPPHQNCTTRLAHVTSTHHAAADPEPASHALPAGDKKVVLPSVPTHWYALSKRKFTYKGADEYCDSVYDGATSATYRSEANMQEMYAQTNAFYGGRVNMWTGYAIEAGTWGLQALAWACWVVRTAAAATIIEMPRSAQGFANVHCCRGGWLSTVYVCTSCHWSASAQQ